MGLTGAGVRGRLIGGLGRFTGFGSLAACLTFAATKEGVSELTETAVWFASVAPDTPLLMTADLQEWVLDHSVDFTMEAVGLIGLRKAQTNERSTASHQRPPALMLRLRTYS